MLLGENIPKRKEMSTFLSCLPTIMTLDNGRSVIVEYMTDKHLSETYDMIQEAARNSDGYGIDEFQSEESFRDEIDGSDCFSVICKESGDLIAGFILTISKFYRGSTGVVDPFIIVKKTERRQRLGEFCLRRAIEYAKKLGYMGMYLDTFSNNLAIQKIVENIGGFCKVGFLPLGGCLQNGEIVGSIIFYRSLLTEGQYIT